MGILKEYAGKIPVLGQRVYLAETAAVIGDVVLGDDVSVWYNSVVRGDCNFIRVGARTNIQDNCAIHVTAGKYATVLEEEVTLGHGAIVVLVSGFAGVAMAFTLPESAGMRVMLFISGVLSVILAVLCLRNFGNPYPVLLLSIWIGVSFIVQGFSIVAVAISYKALPSRGWYGFLGVLSVIAGAVVLAWPWDSIAVLTLYAGILLVVMGIAQIVQGFVMRNDSKTVREVGDVVRQQFHEAKKAS